VSYGLEDAGLCNQPTVGTGQERCTFEVQHCESAPLLWRARFGPPRDCPTLGTSTTMRSKASFQGAAGGIDRRGLWICLLVGNLPDVALQNQGGSAEASRPPSALTGNDGPLMV